MLDAENVNELLLFSTCANNRFRINALDLCELDFKQNVMSSTDPFNGCAAQTRTLNLNWTPFARTFVHRDSTWTII